MSDGGLRPPCPPFPLPVVAFRPAALLHNSSPLTEQFEELCEILEEGRPWTPRKIHALIKDRYDITYDPADLSRKLRTAGMHYPPTELGYEQTRGRSLEECVQTWLVVTRRCTAVGHCDVLSGLHLGHRLGAVTLADQPLRLHVRLLRCQRDGNGDGEDHRHAH